ncbi:hypothetical protein N836_35380 [Leptolyngbya sp. Heron Island J]|nr:hypothetical protein N836_35380 [Leptolyngbya sp. Heron Island J]
MLKITLLIREPKQQWLQAQLQKGYVMNTLIVI